MMDASPDEFFSLFVYGTLKRGFDNHDRFCRGVIGIEEAAVSGELYDLPFGFPALVVARENIYASGTSDYLLDAATQRQLNDSVSQGQNEEGTPVSGELSSPGDTASTGAYSFR